MEALWVHDLQVLNYLGPPRLCLIYQNIALVTATIELHRHQTKQQQFYFAIRYSEFIAALTSRWCFFTQVLFNFFKRATRCFGQEEQYEQQRKHGDAGENKKRVAGT